MPWIIISIFVLIVVVVGVAVYSRNKNLRDEGKIIKRQYAYWESIEYLKAAVTFQEVFDAVRRMNVTASKAKAYLVEGKEQILFKSDAGFNAVLECKGPETGGRRNVFALSFPSYRARNGIPNGAVEMNILATAVDKMFLSLDYDTTVQTRRVEMHTKADFI